MTTAVRPQRASSALGLRTLLFLVAGLLLVLPGSVAGATGPGQDAQPAESVQRKLYSSPQELLRSFMDAMSRYAGLKTYDKEQLAAALDCFHAVPEEVSRGDLRDLAIQLYESISRMTWLAPGQFPEISANARAFEWDLSGISFKPSPNLLLIPEPFSGALPFVRVDSDSDASVPNWRFDPAVLSRAPGWYAQLQDSVVRQDIASDINLGKGKLPLLVQFGDHFRELLPGRFSEGGLILFPWQWLLVATLIAMGLVLGRVVSFLLRVLTHRVERSKRLKVDKQVLVGFERPFSLWFSAWFLLGTLPALQLEVHAFEVLRLGIAVFLAVGGVWAAYRLIDVVAAIVQAKADQTKNRFDDMLVPLVRRTLKVVLTVVGVVYVVSFLTEDLYGIVAGLSIGSLAIGFAAKDSIENMFGTATVLMDKPYQLGDWVTVDGIDGTVESVGFRSTKIRTFWNSLITVPNSRFISAATENWGARRYRRIKTMISLSYATPPLKIEAFCEAVRGLIRKHPYTRKDYYHVYLNEFADSSLNVLVYCFVETPDWSTELREKHRLFLDILRVAQGLEVEIAFPTQTLHVHAEGPGFRPDPPPPESSGYPEPDDVIGAQVSGRQLADLIVREGLEPFGGETPPPVQID